MESKDRTVQVLVISHDMVGAQMAGQGIRYYHIARALAQVFRVTLAVPAGSTIESSDDLPVLTYRLGLDPTLEEAVHRASAVLVPALVLSAIPALAHSQVPVIVDGSDPFLAEALFMGKGDTFDQLNALGQAYLQGDFFICSSERQRDWWLGILEASGRINTWTFLQDPTLRRLVDVVPYGLPGEPPQHTHQVVKGVWAGIRQNDKVLLWGGGLWPWLDPLTAIRAVANLRQHRQDIRLLFPGTRHPNPEMATMRTHNEAARDLARDLGLLDNTVYFGDWTPYTDWPNVLLESDVALMLHHDTLETRLAFRSRVLDCIWADLPVVSTRGDATSEIIARYGAGILVDYQDEKEVSQAVLHLLEQPRDSYVEGLNAARRELTWKRSVQPIVEFCQNPRRAPDKTALGERLGSPFYLNKIAHLQTQIEGYEQGRFMRLMRHLHRWRNRAWRKP